MYNTDIREAAKRENVKLWEIAERLGIADSAFSRKLRRELPQAEKEKILAIVEEISKKEEDLNANEDH